MAYLNVEVDKKKNLKKLTTLNVVERRMHFYVHPHLSKFRPINTNYKIYLV